MEYVFWYAVLGLFVVSIGAVIDHVFYGEPINEVKLGYVVVLSVIWPITLVVIIFILIRKIIK